MNSDLEYGFPVLKLIRFGVPKRPKFALSVFCQSNVFFIGKSVSISDPIRKETEGGFIDGRSKFLHEQNILNVRGRKKILMAHAIAYVLWIPFVLVTRY